MLEECGGKIDPNMGDEVMVEKFRKRPGELEMRRCKVYRLDPEHNLVELFLFKNRIGWL